MGTKKTRETIIFREDVSTFELKTTIGKNFEGDISIYGDIYDDRYRMTDVSIRTNGGTIWVQGGIYIRGELDIEADVMVNDDIDVDRSVKIHGSLYCKKVVSTPKIAVGGDLIAKYVDAVDIVAAGDIVTTGISHVEALGNICFTKETK